MDYFQAVVVDYLRADRAVFVNTECCIQLNPGKNPDTSGPHWYCDALTVNFRERLISLCEVTYSQSLDALIRRLTGWSESWPQLRAALVRDCCLPGDWHVQPCIFIPAERQAVLTAKLSKIPAIASGNSQMPLPTVVHLESVLPWKYPSWNRVPGNQ